MIGKESRFTHVRYALLVAGLALVLALALAGCTDEEQAAAPDASGSAASDPAPTAAAPQEPVEPALNVVATSNIAADWARSVGGDRVTVTGLLPVGADPHGYQPSAQDVAQVADADLVLTIGLSLEEMWLHDLVRNASADEERVVALGDYVSPLEYAEAGEHGDEHEEALVGRLLIADGEQGKVSILDLETGEVQPHTLDVAAANTTLRTSPSGRFVFALARGPEDDDDRVHIFDGGIYLEEHGDHFDLVTEPVSRLTLETDDQRPIHYAIHHGWTAIFNDGSGRVTLFEEHDLSEERNAYEPLWIEAGLQHGAAVPIEGGYLVVSSNNPDYPATARSSLPLGAEVRTLDGRVIYDASNRSCPGLHGEAANAHGVMFGCTGGVLLIEGHDGDFEHVFIDNHPDMLEAARIGTLWAHDATELFFGSASYTQEGERLNGGLWAIDPDSGTMRAVLPPTAEKRVLSTAFDGHGEHMYALTYDGTLNAIEAESGELVDEIVLLDPFDGDTSPAFIIAGETLYLSDRATGRVIEFHLDEGAVEREWTVPGMPRSLAFAGVGVGEDVEEQGHAEEDGHADEHGHGHGAFDPHFWFDPPRVTMAVNTIADRLAALDPAGAAAYRANAAAYAAELAALNAWTAEMVSSVPAERRVLVTSHDSMRYFAELYGFELVGTVIPGLGTDVEPSAQHISALTDTLREHNVAAVFGETTVSERIAQSVAEEAGASLVRIYSGSLGPQGSGADTYLGMVRTNVSLIVEALR